MLETVLINKMATNIIPIDGAVLEGVRKTFVGYLFVNYLDYRSSDSTVYAGQLRHRSVSRYLHMYDDFFDVRDSCHPGPRSNLIQMI